MATIQDVAKRAGVSTATVSHVLNGTRNVLPNTRRNVEQAIAALSYRPSAVARGLQTNITRTVGVLVADVTSFFFAQIVRGLEAAFEPRHYNLMLCNTDEQPERETRYLEMLFDKRVDGIIMVPTGAPQPMLQQFAAQRVPIISIHRKPGTACGPSVLTDDVDAAYQATDYLIKLGHKRIGVLARGKHLSPVIERTQGYMHALRAHQISVDERLIEINHQTAEQTTAAAKRLFSLTPPITAVIAMSLTSTLGLLKAMRELGVSYPDQISVVGIGDAPWMDVLPNPLTVMAAPIAKMCEAAARLTLDAIIQTRHKDESANIITCAQADVLIGAELIVRDSCREI